MAKKATLKDVARYAGVSYQTVSKVLNGQKRVKPETQARIEAAVEALNYHPDVAAKNLRTQSSYLLGYSWQPVRQNYFNPILEQFLQSIDETAESLGYHILLYPLRAAQNVRETYAKLTQTGRVDGFILSDMEYADRRPAVLLDLDIPFVGFGRTNGDEAFPYVDVDGGAGIYDAVQHLLTLGHQKIAILAWPEDSRVGSDRLGGYYRAMAEAGLEITPQWILRGEGEFEYGYAGTKVLLGLSKSKAPTAIVTMGDLIAIGVMRALEEHNLVVGRDVAVTGFDDMPNVHYIKPGLTTLRQPVWQVGERIVNLLIDLLQDNSIHESQVLLKPELVIRGSTQP